MIAKLTFGQFECFGREYNRRGVRAAGDMLAVATVALDHHQWLRGAFVSDIATITTAGDWGLNGGGTHPGPYILAWEELLVVLNDRGDLLP
jgi:hypothetical protein